jgi:SHS2 domain-containing protein
VFEIVQHTADVRLRVRAPSIEDLFRDAMRGMFAIMQARAGDEIVSRRIAFDSVDRTALLVDFLSEVLSRAHIDRALFDEVSFESLTATEIAAIVTGRAPARFEQDIKAVTYHEADVRLVDGAWETMLVFDI